MSDDYDDSRPSTRQGSSSTTNPSPYSSPKFSRKGQGVVHWLGQGQGQGLGQGPTRENSMRDIGTSMWHRATSKSSNTLRTHHLTPISVHPLTHLLVHPLTHPINTSINTAYQLTISTHPLTHLLTHPLTHPSTHPSTHPLTPISTTISTHLLTHSRTHLLPHPLRHYYANSTIGSIA